jgi:glycosyltransferase involved in cell wall biosynthesis
MRRILQITDKPSPGGGIRRVVDQHRAMLDARGWDVRELRLVRAGELASGLTAPVEVGLRLPDTAASVRAVRAAARGVDVVHLHLGFASLSPAFVAAAAMEAPVVVNLHDVSPFDGLGLAEMGVDGRVEPVVARVARWRLARVRRAVWRRICTDAQMIVAPSAYLARLAVAAGAAEGRVMVVPHAVEPVVAEPGPSPSACGAVVVYAGLLSVEKGAPLLLEAFGKLAVQDAELVFVGDGPARVAMKARARGLRVRFLGQLDGAGVAHAMGCCRVVAHPSLVPEGFGLVGIEAMQLGRPVVGFGLGGSGDWLIAGKTGLVAVRQDAEALAGVLDRVLRDAALADRLGAAGREHVARFAADKVADALDGVLRSVLRAGAA